MQDSQFPREVDKPVRTGLAELREHAMRSDTILRAAAQRHASAGATTESIACAVAADIATVQSYLGDNLRPESRRRYFRHAQESLASHHSVSTGTITTAPEYMYAFREWLLDLAPPGQLTDMADVMADHSYLDGLPAPDSRAWQAFRQRRLGNLTERQFVETRMTAVRRLHLAAQVAVRESRDDPELGPPIKIAYRADSATLEAYLVESAGAARDAALMTVTSRWELVSHALSRQSELPRDFDSAVAQIRSTMAGALDPADGRRLAAYFIPHE